MKVPLKENKKKGPINESKGATAIIDRQAQRKHLSFPLDIHILHTHTHTHT